MKRQSATRTIRFVLLAAAGLLLPRAAAVSPPAKPPPPRVGAALPLSVTAGATARLTLRGDGLDLATEVHCQAPKGSAKLLKKGPAPAPSQVDAPRLGGTQVEIEVTLPADYPGKTVTVSVVTPGGESNPQPLLVERGPVIAEKEPNNGLREAMPLKLPAEVAGVIAEQSDVDLFRIEGRAGDKVVVEVYASRVGSLLDPLLTFYNDHGVALASCFDPDGSSDARLVFKLLRDGAYFVAVADANDLGGPNYPYRLSIDVER
jgi:hypothetical protein